MKNKDFSIDITIYYEDTDALGIVYYANYLKYLERCRTEFVKAQGKPIAEWNAEGFFFAVFQVKITYLKPAKLGDVCQVTLRFAGGSDFRKKLAQQVVCDGEVITEAMVELVCLDETLALQEFPAGVFDGP